MDNVFIERLWRSLKCEEVYLKAYETVTETRAQASRSGSDSTPMSELINRLADRH